MKLTFRALAAGLLLALPVSGLVAGPEDGSGPDTSDATAQEPVWAFKKSDVPVDTDYVFGQLDNGMRYILRQNGTPEGTALVRMRIDSGSLDETETERGLSHYLEHMAFNGSTGIPEGEMVKLLEREGLAFGADTNASTGFSAITYKLNLPRNDEDLLDTALMLMRETASELTIAQEAVDRERGVILAERRDRRNFNQRAQEDNFEFLAPGARFADRLPIGTLEVLKTASAEDVRGLYERTYTPRNTVLVIVGDFPVSLMETKLKARFADWTGGDAPVDPETGPVDTTRAGLTDVYLDPSLSEMVSISALGPWIDLPDTIENREKAVLRAIGEAIVNRRLARLARKADAPFRGAGFGTSDIFEDARSTGLSVSSVDGEWRKGMLAAVRVYNEAMTHGFTKAEIEEQLARRRTALENAVKAADTRNNSAFANAALGLVERERIPTTPQWRLEQFERLAPQITPESVFAALKAYSAPLDDPLIRFQGRSAPEGGADALRAAFVEALALPVSKPKDNGKTEFGYTDFGAPGTAVSDETGEELGIRQIVFANGVRLNLKTTDIREDRINVRIAVDGGNLMATKDDPLSVYLASALSSGGLGKHSRDDLTTILAGRSVGFRIGSATDSFVMSSGTTPRDLELQLQVFTALLTDPGYRREGVEQFRKGIDNFFETLTSTPGRALSVVEGGELSDDDPRFTLQPKSSYEALDYAGLQQAIQDRLDRGAIEVALVGDMDEDAAIAAIAATLGALPPREADFLPREVARQRSFTKDRSTRTIAHDGEADQALVRLVWPARDDSDYEESVKLRLLARVMQLELTETIREKLGQAYSPNANARLSHYYKDYGTISISVSPDVKQVDAALVAIKDMVGRLHAGGITQDLIKRARKPLLERHQNALKNLGGWTSLSARAQTEPDRIRRYLDYPATLKAVGAEDIEQLAQQYLRYEDAVTFIVTPSEKAKAEAAKSAE